MEILNVRTGSFSFRPRLSLFMAGAFLLLAQLSSAFAAFLDPEAEYKIKAAYLYNFTKFIEWPATAFPSDKAPYIIGILEGEPIVSRVVAEVLLDKTTGSGRPILIRGASQLEGLLDCQMIFVSRTARLSAEVARKVLNTRPILLVGESEGFAQTGGTINFVVQGKVVRLEINPQQADRVGLRLSGTLASVASLVRDRETRRD